MRPIILIVVLASLCFSVGEGLRLTPFPVSALKAVDLRGFLLDAGPSNETSIYKYGPLDVPSQVQKRSKRQSIDLASVPARDTCDSQILRCPQCERESLNVISRTFVSRPAGRAPPFVS
jgi:hypothetical protein